MSLQTIQATQNEFEVTPHLQWRDRDGQYQNFTGGVNCDNSWGKLTSDSFVLNDHALLPVSAVHYGPLE